MMHPNDFPQMTPPFDQRVRAALESLPERPCRTRRFPWQRVVSIGCAAALSIGGTAFAAGVSGGFPLLFPNGTDAPLTDYVAASEPGTLTDENDQYRLSVESVLFDESAGVGIVSLHLQNKSGDGVMPFAVIELLPEYQNQPDLVWSNLSECCAVQDGQYNFSVMYGEYGFCGSRFYLDKSRSTENDYYLEGAFIPSGDYSAGTPLRLVMQEQGREQVVSNGASIGLVALEVPLPEFQRMPSYTSADRAVTLSQIGLRITSQQTGDIIVDAVEYIAVKMRDGSVVVITDQANHIDRTLYALGFGADAGFDYEAAVYVLARTFDLADVQAVVINDTEYPLSA